MRHHRINDASENLPVEGMRRRRNHFFEWARALPTVGTDPCKAQYRYADDENDHRFVRRGAHT